MRFFFQDNTTELVNSDKFKHKFLLRLNSLGISLIDNSPQELLYISMNLISLQVTQSSEGQTVNFQLGRFQIDNQVHILYKYI